MCLVFFRNRIIRVNDAFVEPVIYEKQRLKKSEIVKEKLVYDNKMYAPKGMLHLNE
jgi:hypothetical protein